jgi:hypothetical protein
MRQRAFVRVGVVAMAVLGAALGACANTATAGSQSVVALPNGYYLQPGKAGQASIVKRGGGRVVPGPIAAYAVSRDIVAGALGEPHPLSRMYTNDWPFKGTPETRYFVLDTSSGRLDSDLDEAAWRRRLDEAGVPASFKIYAPLPFS